VQSHSGQKLFQCTVCGKRFITSGHLDEHRRTHSGEKPYKCHVCDQAFSQSGHYTHTRVHTGEKPHKCSECDTDKHFSDFSSLCRHKHSVHSNTKPYRCPNCGKLFKLNHQLKRHVRIHTDAKPCSCRHCSERFRSSSRYICWSHTMKVLGLLLNFIWQVSHVNSSLQNTFSDMIEAVKPYVCSECQRCFYTAAELRCTFRIQFSCFFMWLAVCIDISILYMYVIGCLNAKSVLRNTLRRTTGWAKNRLMTIILSNLNQFWKNWY